ncbi:hypothetical protein [Nocardia wallacei]|uniref:hypothetical protein n=1 Tax=Nocardia wallacei TaxID=480035 RepID=UPI0024569195|nr:hypothetical protein [Nocardia wallacei]
MATLHVQLSDGRSNVAVAAWGRELFEYPHPAMKNLDITVVEDSVHRRWCDVLGGGVVVGGFDPVAALVAAFTEVELCGAGGCGPAKVLHLLVVEGARGRSSSR